MKQAILIGLMVLTFAVVSHAELMIVYVENNADVNFSKAEIVSCGTPATNDYIKLEYEYINDEGQVVYDAIWGLSLCGTTFFMQDVYYDFSEYRGRVIWYQITDNDNSPVCLDRWEETPEQVGTNYPTLFTIPRPHVLIPPCPAADPLQTAAIASNQAQTAVSRPRFLPT